MLERDIVLRPPPIRVLIVDDESAICTFAERVLREAGYAVDVASTGPDALSIVANEGTFHLFVIDVLMPKMQGPELARQLRERHPDAKVLYCTGYAAFLQQDKKLLSKNESVLAKPVTATELREAVSLLLFDHTHGPAHNSGAPLAV